MGDPEESGEAAGEFLKSRRWSFVVGIIQVPQNLQVKINFDPEFCVAITLDFLDLRTIFLTSVA